MTMKDATIYDMIEHLSVEETARLVIAHEDVREMADTEPAPDTIADTQPLPTSTTAPPPTCRIAAS